MKADKVIEMLRNTFEGFKNDNDVNEEHKVGAEYFLEDVISVLQDERNKEISKIEKDLESLISYDEWRAREYGEEVVDFYETAMNLYQAGYRKVNGGVECDKKGNK